MTDQLEKVKEFMKGKEKVHYKEVSEGTGINKNSVRALINTSVKINKNFIRLGDGYYKLM